MKISNSLLLFLICLTFLCHNIAYSQESMADWAGIAVSNDQENNQEDEQAKQQRKTERETEQACLIAYDREKSLYLTAESLYRRENVGKIVGAVAGGLLMAGGIAMGVASDNQLLKGLGIGVGVGGGIMTLGSTIRYVQGKPKKPDKVDVEAVAPQCEKYWDYKHFDKKYVVRKDMNGQEKEIDCQEQEKTYRASGGWNNTGRNKKYTQYICGTMKAELERQEEERKIKEQLASKNKAPKAPKKPEKKKLPIKQEDCVYCGLDM